MRVLLINQFSPPDPAPTSRYLGDLAAELRASGYEVEILNSGQNYQALQGGSRMVREFQALIRILWQGLWISRCEKVIVMSSPICVLYIGALLALVHRAVLLHWAMDLHPELAVALGEISEGFFYRLIRSCVAWGYRSCRRVVTLDEEMEWRIRQDYGVEAVTIPLWPLQEVRLPEDPSRLFDSSRWICLYSGNLGKGHEWEPLLECQKILEDKGLPIWLVFQGGGPGTVPCQNRVRALGLRQVEWRDYVPEDRLVESLLQARILIVTQREEASGLLWPSKLALAFCLPRPMLWVGPARGSIARSLREQRHHGVFSASQVEAMAAWIESYYRTSLPVVFEHLADPQRLREEGLSQWRKLVEEKA